MEDQKIEVAKKRWRLLGQMLRKGSSNIKSANSNISVRRFSSFGLLQSTPADVKDDADNSADKSNRNYKWYKYFSKYFPEYQVLVRQNDGTVTVEDLLAFDNTGNVCIWPSEEILTYYALKNKSLFEGKKVIELGGGMTCLSGIAIAQCTNVKEILLTDGNEQSISNVNVVIEKNKSSFGNSIVDARVLLWDQYANLGDMEEAFDLVIMADCLFFDDYRADLVNVLQKLLKPQGGVISFAPARGKTFSIFTEMAQEYFSIHINEKYDDYIYELHEEYMKRGKEEYDDNIHYPILLKMQKL